MLSTGMMDCALAMHGLCIMVVDCQARSADARPNQCPLLGHPTTSCIDFPAARKGHTRAAQAAEITALGRKPRSPPSDRFPGCPHVRITAWAAHRYVVSRNTDQDSPGV